MVCIVSISPSSQRTPVTPKPRRILSVDRVVLMNNDWWRTECEWLNEWMTGWLTEWLTEELTDRMNEWLTEGLNVNDWLNEWMAEGLTKEMTEWMNGANRKGFVDLRQDLSEKTWWNTSFSFLLEYWDTVGFTEICEVSGSYSRTECQRREQPFCLLCGFKINEEPMWKWSVRPCSPLDSHSLVSGFFGRLFFPVDYFLLANQGLLVSQSQPPLLLSPMCQGLFLGI